MTAWRQKLPPWLTLILLGLGLALSLPGDTALYVALPTHTAEAGIALAHVGLMLSANRLIRLFINAPYGMVIERVPRRWMLVPSLLIGGLSYFLYTVPGFWPLLIGRLLWGVAWAGIWIGGSTAVLDIATSRNRGRYSGFYQVFFFVGVGGSAVLAGVLVDNIGYLEALRVCAWIALGMGLIWLVFLPETRPAVTSSPAPAAAKSLSTAITPSTAPSRWMLVVAIGLLGVNWLIFIGVLGATLPLLLEERVGQSTIILGLLLPLTTLTGVLTAGNQFLSALVSPFSGWLTDRTGNRWGLVILALLTGVVALALLADGRGSILLLGIVLGAIATSILQTQVMTLVGDHAGVNRQGRILGVVNTIGDLGSAIGPLLAYALLPGIGLSGVYWLMGGALALFLLPGVQIAWREVRTARTPGVQPTSL